MKCLSWIGFIILNPTGKKSPQMCLLMLVWKACCLKSNSSGLISNQLSYVCHSTWQGWLFPFHELQISGCQELALSPEKKKTTLEVCCFGSSCLWALWSNPAEGHQTHREPSSACSLLPWAPEECWVNGDGCQPWWKTPRCPGLMALGTILLMESCQLCHLHAGDFLWKWNKTARGSPDAQDLILLMSLTSLMNQEVSRSKYWIKILSIWLTYCRGFSNLGPMPFGITDNAVVLQRSRLPVKCWLISWLVGWLDVRFRCGLYLSISSS